MNTWLFFLLIISITFSPTDNSRLASPALHDSASDEARVHFDRGLLLLHNFEYPDAAEEFEAAQKLDPSFALACWGEAMTYDHSIWRELDIDKARAALNKLGENTEVRVAKGKTELDKDMIRSVEILFGKGTKPEREKQYSEYMGNLYSKYPTNHDVAAFYALSLFALKKGWSEWEEQNVKAAEITNKILKEDPNHAGALHYLVHADDHPRYADRGLDAADRYAKVASYAGHALHMPSHIYLALGMWDDVVRANEVAWKASVDRNVRKGLNNDQLSYHAHLWLSYGYVQQGRFAKAKKLIDDQTRYASELSSPKARFHLMEMRGHYLLATEEWNSPLADAVIKTDNMDVRSRHTSMLLDGYKYFQRNNRNDLDKLIVEFEEDLAKTRELQKTSEDVAVCISTRYVDRFPTAGDIKRGDRYLNQLKAMRAWMSNENDLAEKYFVATMPAEGAVVVGPPDFVISPNELYGQFLLAMKRPAEAIKQFDWALSASPNRLVSLKGKLKAARDINDKVIETSVITQLKKNLKEADAEILRRMGVI